MLGFSEGRARMHTGHSQLGLREFISTFITPERRWGKTRESRSGMVLHKRREKQSFTKSRSLSNWVAECKSTTKLIGRSTLVTRSLNSPLIANRQPVYLSSATAAGQWLHHAPWRPNREQPTTNQTKGHNIEYRRLTGWVQNKDFRTIVFYLFCDIKFSLL